MHLNEIRKGLLGFRKNDVFAYISAIEEEYSKQVAHRETGYKRELEEYRKKIALLTEEIREKETVIKEQEEKLKEAKRHLYAASHREMEKNPEPDRTGEPEAEEREKTGCSDRKGLSEKEALFRERYESGCAAKEKAWEKTLSEKIQETRNTKPDPAMHNMRLFQRRWDDT